MSVGLFLDVDNTLTRGLIQRRFAELLSCEDEYENFEKAFQADVISAEDFGDRLIALFRKAGFTQEFASENFSKVRLQPWTADVLGSSVAVYLVSSGPSYYIAPLAEKYRIPQERVLCSVYRFSAGDGLLESCEAVSAADKARFVRDKVGDHSITIGIGDDEAKDGPFIGQCSIPLLINARPSDAYMQVSNFGVVKGLLNQLGAESTYSRQRPSVFIGSSMEGLPIAEAMQVALEQEAAATVWNQGLFTPSGTNIEALETALASFDFAVLVLSPDDVVSTRGETRPHARDNVTFELGLFMGRLSRERCFILRPRTSAMALPTDLAGVAPLSYDSERALSEPDAAVGPAATAVRRRVRELQFRRPGL
jgi:predicted nucleotide-binding protein/phosphoserine phosphatase